MHSKRSKSYRVKHFQTFFLSCLLGSAGALADEIDPLDLSLEELQEVRITSVSKKEERSSQAAAAVFVIERNDIERSSATTLPDLLRMVPGLQVARGTSNSWAITSRGFNSNFANKLLVLVDGKTVYNPTFAGVNWDSLQLPLDEIERIEVIRGPGATVWGANAVNGVINIITKMAKDTQGAFVSVGGGNQAQMISGARYGGKIGESGFARVYANGAIHDESKREDNTNNYDGWNLAQSGFRYDFKPTSNDLVTVNGNYLFGTQEGQQPIPLLTAPYSTLKRKNGNLNSSDLKGRWEHTHGDEAYSVQAFILSTDRDLVLSHEKATTYDVEFQRTSRIHDKHLLTAGLGYRFIESGIESLDEGDLMDSYIAPRTRHYEVVNGFLQDEFSLFSDELKVSAGTKLEYRGYTGLQVQPGVRISYAPTAKSLVWASIARAIRSPSQVERDIQFPYLAFPDQSGATTLIQFKGSGPGLNPETMLAYEIGVRFQPASTIQFDVATFVNHYDDLIIFEQQDPQIIVGEDSTQIQVTNLYKNGGTASAYGAEFLTTWTPYSWWKTQAWYTWFAVDDLEGVVGPSVSNQFYVRSLLTTDNRFEIDPSVRFVDNLSSPTGNVPSYIACDLRIGYALSKRSKVSVIGQNLFDSGHVEFIPAESPINAANIGRAVFVRVDWQFE